MKTQEKSKRECMIEKLAEENNECLVQADLQKKLQDSKQRQDRYTREALIYGAHYYDDEKIEQISEDSIKYLKVHDVDTEDYKERFKDIEKMELSDLEFLHKREDEIEKFKKVEEFSCESVKGEKNRVERWILDCVNSINGGEFNES